MKTADQNMQDALHCLSLEVEESIVHSLKIKYALAIAETKKFKVNEIKQLVGEMKGNPKGMELTKEEYNIYLCGYDDALTEFKSKIGV